MRRLTLILAAVLVYSISCFAHPGNNRGLKEVIIYAMSYRWDTTNNDWQLPVKQVYNYDSQGLFVGTLSMNPVTNDTISRVVYVYNQDEELVEYYSQTYISGTWVNGNKYELAYNDAGGINSLILMNWKNGTWVNSRFQTDYIYGSDGKLISFETRVWSGSQWVDSKVEYYYYDIIGNLDHSLSQDESGININQVFYGYDEMNNRTDMLVQAWNRTTQAWTDSYRDTYLYNNCGNKAGRLRERFTSGLWINESREEYFWGFNSTGTRPVKVPVCHNGHTIYISPSALPAHLAHGDCLGKCAVEEIHRNKYSDDELSGTQYSSTKITVFPNPAESDIRITLDSNEEDIFRIELRDYSGYVLRSIPVNNCETEFIIQRDGLKNGLYLLYFLGSKTTAAKKIILN